MPDDARDEQLFERLSRFERPELRAPSRLKSRVYSALLREAAREHRIESLTQTREHGSCLCVFEKFVQILPLGAGMDTLNYCRFCHGRVLGEAVEGAPLFWKGCPYADFQHR
jgi:hypothetical protein